MPSLEEKLNAILSDPALVGNPLLPYCEQLLEDRRKLNRRLDRIGRISDGYQAQLKQLNTDLTNSVEKLATALGEVRTLRGYIPICSRCKRVRDDEGYWDEVETYLGRHSEAVLSQAVCPSCQSGQPEAAAPSRSLGQDEQEEKDRLERLLENPDYFQNPLLDEHVRVSQRFMKLARRLDKISKISDGFQAQLKDAQSHLTDRNQRLQQINEQKNLLLGMAAHDLRNPLSSILGYSQFLLVRPNSLDPQATKFLKNMTESARFMLELVEDLLDVSTLEAGELRLALQLLDLRGLVEKVVQMNAPLAEHKRIRVDYRAPEDRVMVEMDLTKIDQVLTNLVTNAVKYSFPDSSVQVDVIKGDRRARVTVSDHGPGIPESEQALLFQPFGRTSVRSTGGEKSTGLGLAIARRIVEGHRGEMGFSSKVGMGSTFWFSLPLVETR